MNRLLWLLLPTICSGVRRWPNAIVPYSFSDQFDSDQRRLILDAMDTIHAVSCVRFVPSISSIDHEGGASSPHVHFRLSKPGGGGCWSSYTGYSGRRQTVSLEANDACFSSGTLLHELMHVLGFEHEHNRPDRDQYVEIIWDRIEPPAKWAAFVRRQWIDARSIDSWSPYDERSIMHYSEYAFGTEYGVPTMISKRGLRLGGVETLSPTDVERIRKIYECS